jgi:hypothetical protein
MLRFNVEVSADGAMQARGVLSAGPNVQRGGGERLCEKGLASRRNTQRHKTT